MIAAFLPALLAYLTYMGSGLALLALFAVIYCWVTPIDELKLIRDNGVEAPRLKRDGSPVTQGLGTEAMWRSMRIIGSFNGRELAAHASACGIEVKESTAKAYIIVLHAAGYLKVVEAAKLASPGKPPAQARYVLAPGKYTGPRPPMIQRTKTLYDPNLAKVVWNEEIDHDDL